MSKARYCPSCHSRLEEGEKKCPLCGEKYYDISEEEVDSNLEYDVVVDEATRRVSFQKQKRVFKYIMLLIICNSVIMFKPFVKPIIKEILNKKSANTQETESEIPQSTGRGQTEYAEDLENESENGYYTSNTQYLVDDTIEEGTLQLEFVNLNSSLYLVDILAYGMENYERPEGITYHGTNGEFYEYNDTDKLTGDFTKNTLQLLYDYEYNNWICVSPRYEYFFIEGDNESLDDYKHNFKGFGLPDKFRVLLINADNREVLWTEVLERDYKQNHIIIDVNDMSLVGKLIFESDEESVESEDIMESQESAEDEDIMQSQESAEDEDITESQESEDLDSGLKEEDFDGRNDGE